MDEKIKIICIGFVAIITFLILLSETALYISKFFDRKKLILSQHQLKIYYLKYKNELENKVELKLDTPLRLELPVYSDHFSNNAELRRAFMQVCYIFRDLSNLYGEELTQETEDIFTKIRQFAYQNGEPFERSAIK